MGEEQANNLFGALHDAQESVRRLEAQLETRNAELQDRAAALQETVARLEKENVRRREAEARLRALFENIPIPTAAWRMHAGRFVLTAINAAAVDRLGGNTHAWLGAPPEALFGPGTLAVEAMGQAYTGECSVRASSDWRHPRTGEIRNWDITCGFVPPDSVAVHFDDVTEQLAAAEALRTSEQRYRRLFEDASIGIFQLTPAGRALAVNPAFAAIFGYDSPEAALAAIGSAAEDLYVVAGRQDEVRQLIESGEGAVIIESEYKRKDGTRFIGRLHAWAVREGAQTHYYEGFIVDITAHKEAEEAVKKRDAWFRDVLNQASDGGWEHDFLTGITQTTDSFWSNLGYAEPRNTLPSSEWAKLTHQEDYERGREAQKDFLEGKTPRMEAELRIRRSGGDYAWLLSRGVAAERDDEGVPIRVMGTVTDITSRKVAEERLRQYERAVESARDMIAVFDQEARFRLVNEAFLREMNLKREAVLGQLAEDIFGEEAALARLASHWERCLDGQSVSFNFAMKRGEGLSRILTISFAPLHRGDAHIDGVVAVARDTTEIMLARQELQEQGKTLRRLAAQLAQTSENERRALSRELHDQIGQELTGLRLLLDTASRAAEPPPSLRQARSLVEDLLNRVRELSLTLRPQMLDDLGLVPALLWLLETYSKQTGIKVDFRHERIAGVRFGEAVETGAFRIVQEALTNVARHAKTQAACVRIVLEGGMLSVSVSDEGEGFDLRAQEKARQSTGLVGMRERALALGGGLNLGSEPGQGTTIEAWLPTQAVEKEEQQTP